MNIWFLQHPHTRENTQKAWLGGSHTLHRVARYFFSIQKIEEITIKLY